MKKLPLPARESSVTPEDPLAGKVSRLWSNMIFLILGSSESLVQ